MPLADWQFSYNGAVVGAGTPYRAYVSGLIDRNVEKVAVPLTGDGEVIGRIRRLPKLAVFTIEFNDPADVSGLAAALLDAWDGAAVDEELRWKVPHITNERNAIGAPGQYGVPLDKETGAGIVKFTGEIHIPDGLIRDAVTGTPVRF